MSSKQSLQRLKEPTLLMLPKPSAHSTIPTSTLSNFDRSGPRNKKMKRTCTWNKFKNAPSATAKNTHFLRGGHFCPEDSTPSYPTPLWLMIIPPCSFVGGWGVSVSQEGGGREGRVARWTKKWEKVGCRGGSRYVEG